MDKVIAVTSKATYTGVSVSAASSMLGFFEPHEWQVIGILGGLFFAGVTCAANIYFQSKRLNKDEKRKSGDRDDK